MLGLSERVERRDQRHRVHEHAGRAAVRARARLEVQPRPRRIAGGSEAARRLHVRAQPQLGREGGAARRLRQDQRAHRAARRLATPCAPNRSTSMVERRHPQRPRALRRGRDDRHDDVDRARSARRDRARRRGERHLAARRCGDGRLGDDPAGVPLDVAGRRARRFADRQPAQVARRGVRLHRCTSSAIPSISCA